MSKWREDEIHYTQLEMTRWKEHTANSEK
jgi:hypothetical protein